MNLVFSFLVGFDVWIGLQNEKHIQIFDSDPDLFQPLQEAKVKEWMYSDNTAFNPETDYKYGARKLKAEECVYLRQSSDFEVNAATCSKEKAFLCLWTSKF